jgi:hypothetical protein
MEEFAANWLAGQTGHYGLQEIPKAWLASL